MKASRLRPETPWPEAAIFQWQPATSEPSFSCWVVDRGEDFSWWTRAWESSVFLLFVGKRIATLEAAPQMTVNVRLQGHWSLSAGLKKHCGSWRAGPCAHPLAFLWERLWFCSTQETSSVNRQTPDTWWPRLPCSPSLGPFAWRKWTLWMLVSWRHLNGYIPLGSDLFLVLL